MNKKNLEKNSVRKEKDMLGEVAVPKNVYWGIHTQRTLQNFNISDRRFPWEFIRALAIVKKACVQTNKELGNISEKKYTTIKAALTELLEKDRFKDQFPIDVFQTGSGTQINMNMNEVITNRANEILGFEKGRKEPIHPNDDVNRSQSSNDVIPTTMHIMTTLLIDQELLPALHDLQKTLLKKIQQFQTIVKIGRTHLQDAVPIKLSTEFEVYNQQIILAQKRLTQAQNELLKLPIGGTAVGTGLNAPKGFGKKCAKNIAKMTNKEFTINDIQAESIASHNRLVTVSSVLKQLALTLLKLANDIRLLGSGPRAGFGELLLPKNEPGSSIMPGKINPTQSEAIIQVCLQVIGNDTVITQSEAFGSMLDMNVTKPLIIWNIIDAIKILSKGVLSFTKNCLEDLQVNKQRINQQLETSLMIVTRLTPLIGYDKSAEIAQKAYETGKTIKEIIEQKGIKFENQDLEDILDPKKMV
ncbi:MAG: class II fumarate hydratase [Asgard group archaeon]|nr:class II fumarate hydratase [Asgard group archaeon]